MFMFLFLFFSMLFLIFQSKRIISSEKWCDYVVPVFFLKMPKIWVGWTTVNGEKKEDGLTSIFSRKILFRDRSLSEMITSKFRVQNEMNQIIK